MKEVNKDQLYFNEMLYLDVVFVQQYTYHGSLAVGHKLALYDLQEVDTCITIENLMMTFRVRTTYFNT